MPSQLYVYELNGGTESARIRIDDAGAALAISGGPTLLQGSSTTLGTLSAAVSGNRNRIGLFCRGLRLQRFTGTGANRKRFTTFLPITTEAAWDTAAIGQAVTLNGQAYTVADKVVEERN